jgi:sugar (pentulose or hexulose) kinase
MLGKSFNCLERKPTMEKQYLLGVDIGTYSSKGVLVEAASGRQWPNTPLNTDWRCPNPAGRNTTQTVCGGASFAPSAALLVKSGVKAEDVKAVGTSGLGACALPIGADGKPLRKPFCTASIRAPRRKSTSWSACSPARRSSRSAYAPFGAVNRAEDFVD